MKGAILAGGRGTRLRPLTLKIPKVLLPVARVPLLRHQIERLHAGGIRDLAVCTLPDTGVDWPAFRAELPEGTDLEIFIEESPLGTGGALRSVVQWLGGDRLFAINGDDVTDADPRLLVDAHASSGAAATIGLRRVEPEAEEDEEEAALSREVADPTVYGNVRLDDERRVTAFLEKPSQDEATGLINAGQYVLEADALASMPAGRPFSIEREGFPGLLEAGRPIRGVVLDAYHRPVNTPAQYLQVHRDLYDGRWRPGWMEQTEGRNQIGGNCTVWPGAALGENVTLGEDCVIGAEAELEDVVLQRGVRVGPGARVRRSVLGPGCRVGHHARLVGCVLGGGTHVPPWSSLGELEPGRRGEEAT